MIRGGRRLGPEDPGSTTGAAENAAGPDADAPQVTTGPANALPSADTTATRLRADAPPLRTDVIDRMRWLLAAGDIGRDHAGLAESLIVSMARRS